MTNSCWPWTPRCEKEAWADTPLSNKNSFLPSELLSTEVTTQPLKWIAPRGSSPWRREESLMMFPINEYTLFRWHKSPTNSLCYGVGHPKETEENPFQSIRPPPPTLLQEVGQGDTCQSGLPFWSTVPGQGETLPHHTPWENRCMFLELFAPPLLTQDHDPRRTESKSPELQVEAKHPARTELSAYCRVGSFY